MISIDTLTTLMGKSNGERNDFSGSSWPTKVCLLSLVMLIYSLQTQNQTIA